MPACCAPCPGKRKATEAAAASGSLVTTRAGSTARNASAASAAPRQTSMRRWRKGCRPTWRVKAVSARRRAVPSASSSGHAARWPARAAVAASRAAGVFADSTSRCAGRLGRSPGGIAGASSRITCALVPPMPNELTPARRGSLSAGQGVARVLTKKGPKSIRGFGRSKWRLGGRIPSRRASTVLIRPAAPEAASRCPMLVFTDPMAQGGCSPPSPSGDAAKAAFRAATSIGSPSAVPVPCASTYWMLAASTPALASAARSAAACPSTLGAVKPTLAVPSLLLAEPRMTARTVSPSATASSRRFRTTAPTPLPPTTPWARASKARVWPSGEAIPPSW